jgi:hypothetical protein
MVAFSVTPGYRREQPVKRPKLGPWVGVIDAILDDKQRPAKQRHTAKRVWERLKMITSCGRDKARTGPETLHERLALFLNYKSTTKQP